MAIDVDGRRDDTHFTIRGALGGSQVAPNLFPSPRLMPNDVIEWEISSLRKACLSLNLIQGDSQLLAVSALVLQSVPKEHGIWSARSVGSLPAGKGPVEAREILSALRALIDPVLRRP